LPRNFYLLFVDKKRARQGSKLLAARQAVKSPKAI